MIVKAGPGWILMKTAEIFIDAGGNNKMREADLQLLVMMAKISRKSATEQRLFLSCVWLKY